jgi:hypothetical protein
MVNNQQPMKPRILFTNKHMDLANERWDKFYLHIMMKDALQARISMFGGSKLP